MRKKKVRGLAFWTTFLLPFMAIALAVTMGAVVMFLFSQLGGCLPVEPVKPVKQESILSDFA